MSRDAARRRLGLLPRSDKRGSSQNVVTRKGPTGVQLQWVPASRKSLSGLAP